MTTAATNRPRAYSYVRFSTPEQAAGDSLRRQIAASERYASIHGLDLDDSLTFRDLGKSAFFGGNVETGHLGEFLAFVESGDIPTGSFLLVESLDRLSRQKPRKAVKLLERICEAGVTVVTLDDNRIYTEEVLDDDPMALMVALLVAARAYEESAKKGKRVAAAWANKRANAGTRPLTAISNSDIPDTRTTSTEQKRLWREAAKRRYHASEEKRLAKIAQIERYRQENPEKVREVKRLSRLRSRRGRQRTYRKEGLE